MHREAFITYLGYRHFKGNSEKLPRRANLIPFSYYEEFISRSGDLTAEASSWGLSLIWGNYPLVKLQIPTFACKCPVLEDVGSNPVELLLPCFRQTAEDSARSHVVAAQQGFLGPESEIFSPSLFKQPTRFIYLLWLYLVRECVKCYIKPGSELMRCTGIEETYLKVNHL